MIWKVLGGHFYRMTLKIILRSIHETFARGERFWSVTHRELFAGRPAHLSGGKLRIPFNIVILKINKDVFMRKISAILSICLSFTIITFSINLQTTEGTQLTNGKNWKDYPLSLVDKTNNKSNVRVKILIPSLMSKDFDKGAYCNSGRIFSR